MTLVDGEELLRIIGTGLWGETLEFAAPVAVSISACPCVRRSDGSACCAPGAARGTPFLGVLDLSCMPWDRADPRRDAGAALIRPM
jgi:hypothetical protein